MEQGLIRYFPQLPFGSYSKCQLLTHPLVTSLWTFHTLTSAHKPVMIHSEPLSCFILLHTVCLTRTPKAQSTCMVNPREQPKAVGRELSGHVRSSQLPATADSFILCCLNSYDHAHSYNVHIRSQGCTGSPCSLFRLDTVLGCL